MEGPTPEEQKAAEKQAIQRFLEDISNVEKNHNKKLIAIIERSITGSQAKIITIPLTQFEEATKKT